MSVVLKRNARVLGVTQKLARFGEFSKVIQSSNRRSSEVLQPPSSLDETMQTLPLLFSCGGWH